MNTILICTAFLLFLNWITQLWLDFINVEYAVSSSLSNPAGDEHYSLEEREIALDYLKANSVIEDINGTYKAFLFAVVLFSGILPWFYQITIINLSVSIWSNAFFIFVVTLLFSIADMPFDWYRQFVLEERFGFNQTTQALWLKDRIIGLILAIVLLYPLLALILWVVGITGGLWWLWVWAVLIAYQLLMLIIAPNWIMPLFNKFTPMEEGRLKTRLQDIAQRANVEFESISVMDGSKRSSHSNAFLSGLGKFKRIALFDTLIDQLNEDEITAVTAHELGHYVRKHIVKKLVGMSLLLLIELFMLAWLIEQPWLLEPFGFEAGNFATGLLLLSMLSGLITFWLNPINNYFSRKHEYEADAYAKELTGDHAAMVSALQIMEKENLSNPSPHPLYSGFYYSHPSVSERVNALEME